MNLVRPEIDAMEDSPILDVWRTGIALPGVIGLWAGEPDTPTPAFICDAAIEALREGHTFYTHNRGIPELRPRSRATCALYGVDIRDNRIAATSAGMSAVADHLPGAARRRVEGGSDHAVLAEHHARHDDQRRRGDGSPAAARNSGWSLDLERGRGRLRRRGRRCFIWRRPANPTGWTITREEAEALLEMTRTRGIALM